MERWVKYAAKLAATGTGKYRLASIVFDKRGRIISTGINSYARTHPQQAKYAQLLSWNERTFLHAEIAALVKCHRRPHSILSVRIDREGKTRLAKPCPICEIAIREAGIKVIQYTT